MDGAVPRPGRRRSIWGSGSPSPSGVVRGSGWWMCVSPFGSEAAARTGSCLHRQSVSYSLDQGAPVPVGVACPLFAGNGLVGCILVAQLYTRLPVATLGPHCWPGKPAPSTSSCSGSRSMGQGQGQPSFLSGTT